MTLLERGPLLDELGRLLAAARHGNGQLVLVTGEAGAGKTALIDEFCASRTAPAIVLKAACVPDATAKPFAPAQDLAQRVGGSLRKAVDADDRDAVFEEVLRLLRRPGIPATVLVLEDLHWADEPTADLIRVIGRRLRDLRTLVIGSCRDEGVGAEHPLRWALADVPRGVSSTVDVPALSLEAVRRLARGTGVDAGALHDATGGNAFLVTETIRAHDEAVPSTITHAVGTRAGRLSAAARRALKAAAVLGYPADDRLIAGAAAGRIDDVDECLRHGLLVDAHGLRTFRHELARLAVLETTSKASRAAVHRRSLTILRHRARRADPARLAQHAIGSGDHGAIVELAPPAATRAASLGAHREAAALYAAAIDAAEGMPVARLAVLLEAHALESSFADRVEDALGSQRRAVDAWREAGERVREGDARRALSGYMWLSGRGEAAIAEVRSAIELLESVAPRSPALALALSTLAQRLSVSAGDDAGALAAGRQALALAAELGLERVAVHALTTVGAIEINPGDDPAGIDKIEESFQRAAAAGITDEATRALINLVEVAQYRHDLVSAARYLERAEAWLSSEARQDFMHQRLLRTRRMELDFERGLWSAASRDADELLALPSTASQVRARALTVLGRLRARRGDGDPRPLLDEALGLVGLGELQELVPLRAARAEAALLAGDLEASRREAAIGLELALTDEAANAGWWWGDLAYWAWRAGVVEHLPERAPEPYRLQEARRLREAAAAWAALGHPYQQALALADSADAADLRTALAVLHRLGARPMASVVAARLRGLGIRRVPRGPYRASRANPAGLTGRELEVLRLIRGGARNADIASALTVSVKTVDHHVSAVLHKLGVPNRRAAAGEAIRLDV